MIIASSMMRTEIGKKNVSNIPSPKHVIATPATLLGLLNLRIIFHLAIIFSLFLLLYAFSKKTLMI